MSCACDRLALWAPQAVSKGVTLAAAPDISGAVLAVPGALEQILDNLISNAVNASPPDSTITLTTDHTTTQLTLHVIDQGPG